MSLNKTYDPDNILAKIIRGDIPSYKIFEDEKTLAIMDAFPQSSGHSLVLPKQMGFCHILDLPAETLANLIVSVQKTAKAVKQSLAPDGLIISQFNGKAAGQTIFHPHFHIIPIYENHGLKSHAKGEKADDALLAQQAARISKAFFD